MRTVFFVFALFFWLYGRSQSQPLRGIWKQPSRGLTLQLEQHGPYVYGKVIGTGKQQAVGILKFDFPVKPGHFALTELSFIRPGIWIGRWNSGKSKSKGNQVMLKSQTPDCWQLYCKRGPVWVKIKNGDFVPERQF